MKKLPIDWLLTKVLYELVLRAELKAEAISGTTLPIHASLEYDCSH